MKMSANPKNEYDGDTLTVRPTSDLPASSPRSPGLLTSPELLSNLGIASGQQIRLRRTDDEFGVFTVEAVRGGERGYTAWLNDDGRARLGTHAAFEATVESPVPNRTQTVKSAARQGEYVEQVRDGGDRGLVIGAPHGGNIEPYTDRQASRVADQLTGSTAWIGRGWRPGGGAYERWHVTSTDIHPASFPGLGRIANHGFENAVSFHGFSGDGILIGGGATRRVKRKVQTAIEDAVGEVIDVRQAADGAYAGSDPENFVNWLTMNGQNGVQLEQSLEARTDYWQLVADAVVGVFDS